MTKIHISEAQEIEGQTNIDKYIEYLQILQNIILYLK